ncbi:hypothetical protein CSPX01_09258 [Colletotrichum filicis]|nr:hypothetical protein CSPX01_09258 [Colletotrichum filicis]
MELPSEILDQVLDGLMVYQPLAKVRGVYSLGDWKFFTSHSARLPVNTRHGSGSLQKFNRGELPPIGGGFWNLRLVSRQWNSSVIRMLQKHEWWSVPFDDRNRLEKLIRICDGPDGGPCSWIRSLSLHDLDGLRTFSRLYSYDFEMFEGQDVDDDYIILNSYHIERFSVEFPAAHSKHDLMANCYDMQGVDEVLATVKHGLTSPGFQHLVDLSFAVPSTWHIGQLAGGLSQDARDRLRKLRLVIVDETGPSGSAQYTKIEEENNDGDRTTILGSVAPSNVQATYPNREHQDALWALVASCPKLEALGIEATHYLNLDLQQWNNPRFESKYLRDLSLRRI